MSFGSKDKLLPNRTVRERYGKWEEITNYQYFCISTTRVSDFIQWLNNPNPIDKPEMRSIEAAANTNLLYVQVIETTELRPNNWFWKREICFRNGPFQTENDLPEAEMVVSMSAYPPQERKGLLNKILRPKPSVLVTMRVSTDADNMFGQTEINTTFLFGSERDVSSKVIPENITNAFEKLTGMERSESIELVTEKVVARVERAHNS